MDFLLIDRGMGQSVVAGGSGRPRLGTIVFVCFSGGAGVVVDGCASSNKICRINPKIEFVGLILFEKRGTNTLSSALKIGPINWADVAV